MVGETTDVSKVEQVVVCLRWVSEQFEVQEEFIGLYEVAMTGAEVIYAAITDVLLRLNLFISKLRCAASATMALLPCLVGNSVW